MKKSDWGIEVIRIRNGFTIKDNEGNVIVVEEKEDDEIAAAEELLWQIIEFFDLRGDRHARERVKVIREVGDKYEPQEGEEIVEESFRKLIEKQAEVKRKGGQS